MARFISDSECGPDVYEARKMFLNELTLSTSNLSLVRKITSKAWYLYSKRANNLVEINFFSE